MRTLPATILALDPGLFRDPSLFTTFSAAKLAPALWPFLVALISTSIAIWPVRWLALRLGAIARPGGRNINRKPIPRLGGLAMFLGFALSSAIYSTNGKTLGLLLSAAGITALMVLDDLHEVSPLLKVAFQVGVSLVAVLVVGIHIDFLAIPGLRLIILALPVSLVLTAFWFVAMQNTINLLDGVDGLAAGVVAIVAGAILVAAVNLLKPDIVILAGALIGACLGFLLFNWHPARVIMGDAGSHFLGFTLAALSVMSVAKGAVIFALVVPIIALAIPILDTGWAILRRRLRGQSIAAPDAEHLHHRLLDYGLSPRETALLFYFGTAIFAAIGLTIYGHQKILLVAVGLMLLGIVVIVARRSRRTGR